MSGKVKVRAARRWVDDSRVWVVSCPCFTNVGVYDTWREAWREAVRLARSCDGVNT